MPAKQQGTILLVEGKRKVDISFSAELERKGYLVKTVESGSEGIQLLDHLVPSVIIINAASLRTNGLRIVNRFHNCLPKTPVILIVSADEELSSESKANALLRLPFTVQKLVNRLKSFTNTTDKNLLTLGPLQLNLQTKMVSCNGKESHLTPRLCRLLKQLMESPGQILAREELFKLVWDTDYTGDTRTLDVHISWLRQAIEENPRKPVLITTERAIGYKLNL